jgi:hypothetical protein
MGTSLCAAEALIFFTSCRERFNKYCARATVFASAVLLHNWSVLSQKWKPVLRPDTRQSKEIEQDVDLKKVFVL